MADEAHEWTDEQIAKLARKFEKTYSQAAEEMGKKLKTFMADYEEKNAEWKERVKRGDATQDEYKEWLGLQSIDSTFIRNMADTLARDATDADRLARAYVNDEIPAVYAENANYAAYSIEDALEYDTHSFDLYDQSTVRNLMANDPNLVPMADIDGEKDYRWNRQKMSSAITQSILQGESIPNTAKRLRSVLAMDKRASVMAARTAMTCAQNAGRIDSYKRAKSIGIDVEQEWLATLDERTRTEHRLLDGQHVPVDGVFKVPGYGDKYNIRFPGDPRALGAMVWGCRCTLIPWLEGIEAEDPERWSRLQPGMTYDEWKTGKKAEKKQEGEHG